VRDGYTDASGRKWTGKNVVIAVIDTGVDVSHPDFIEYDERGNPTSRFEYFWDTTLDFRAGRGDKAPFSFPNRTPIGTLFHQKHLTEGLRAISKGAPPSIPLTDEDGHGTACASIAAGNGNADQSHSGLKRDEVIGVAPDALLIGVRIGKNGASLKNAYLLNAICEWLDRVAGDRPLVISSSFGGNGTGHDGQSVNERELNARFSYGERRGRAMVVAAGNESHESIHARVTFGGIDNSKLVTWEAKVPTDIRLFFNNPSARNLKIIPFGDANIGEEQLRWELNRITNQVQATLSVKAGVGRMRLFNTAGEKTEAHLYFAGSKAGRFDEGVDNNYLVTSPGTAQDVITVGSYDWNDNFHRAGAATLLASTCRQEDGSLMSFEVGVLSCYSSQGPTRDNRYKPDMVAPGQWYTASHSASAHGWTVDTTGRYVAMNGTSAAAPYTAGVLALLFEEAPDLTVNRIKQLLRENSTKSSLKPSYGDFPNAAWGSGKLDMAAVERMFESLKKSRATE
jgi:subtilisin family serine protease